ncbi:MAG: exosortase system-associated protein, TIGR04073 family [Candidatus Omnitrophica bacterium]|nr:exosortase system-associated protein, TIGR04073 family [Candidatus Omnitrophota bacterium]
MQQLNLRIIVIATLFVLLISPWAIAGEGTTGDYMGQIGTKFGRGLVNVITSPAEIPCRMGDDMEVKGAAGFFTGFGKGIYYMLRRILNGVTEIGTFMIPGERDIPPVCQDKI